jgi:DNA-binding transcriptional LysR family regulator
MKEAHLRDFIAVADSGSVRAAARGLKISQGAISKNLLALERELGVPLLVRSAHGVEPTEYGRVLLRRARLADLELRRAQEEIAGLAGHAHGVVNGGFTATAEAQVAPAAIARFRLSHPDTRVHMHGGTAPTLLALLREGKLDFAIAAVDGKALGAGLHSERLFSADFAVVARDGHPLAHATKLEQLAGCEWVHGARPGELDPLIVPAFQREGLPPPHFAVERDSFSALVFLLLQSDYLAIATEPTVAPFCRKGLLARVAFRKRPAVSVQSLLTPATRPLAPQASAFVEEIRRVAKALRR